MLMLLFGPGVVGGLVIPILGAVPDGAIILLSGMGAGTKEEIQNQLSVGVGTLVGSTVMLLTLPWAGGIFLGRCDYDESSNCAATRKPKLTHTSLLTNCVTVQSDIPQTSKIMFASLLTYLIIQLPSLSYQSDADGGVSREHPWALGCLIFSAVSFFVYCWSQVQGASAAERDRRLQEYQRREQWKKTLDRKLTEKDHQANIFRQYDRDHSGFIEAAELSLALQHLGLKSGRKDVHSLMDAIDVGHVDDGDAGKADGRISLREFQAAVDLWVAVGQDASNITDAKDSKDAKLGKSPQHHYGSVQSESKDGGDEEAEADDDEGEEEFWELSQSELKLKACMLLLFGTLVVTITSDPMVDVITQVGDRLAISPFYVAFVVTPLASNASEVYASLLFARRKTSESISMTLSTLHGAATMNSTLCLAIFMSIVYSRGLEWEYTAEVATVIVVVAIVALQCMFRRNIFLWQAILVVSLYPGAIIMVYLMQRAGFQ